MTSYLRHLIFIALLILYADNFANSSPICGDADGDGAISILDALIAAKLSVDNPGSLNPSYCLADINNSGTFTILDSLAIAKQAIGYHEVFQCQDECLQCLLACTGRCSSTQACVLGESWSSSSPVSSTQYLEIYDFIVDSEDRIYIIGKFDGDLIVNGLTVLSASLPSIFIARLDSNYNHEWSRSFPLTGATAILLKPSRLAFDSSGKLIALFSLLGTLKIDEASYYLPSSSAIIAKFNNDTGQTIWKMPLHGWGEPAFALDQQDNIFIGATIFNSAKIDSTWIYSTGFTDILIAKVDTNGNLLTWNQYGSSQTEDYITALAVDNSTDSVVVAGETILILSPIGFSFGGETLGLWTQNFMIKFNKNLAHEWTLPLQADFHTTQLQYDRESNIVSSGWFQNDITIGDKHIIPIPNRINGFVAKFNHADSPLWILPILANSLGGVFETNDFKKLQIDADGNIIQTGEFIGSINIGGFTTQTLGQNRDKFITKIDKRGFYLWVNTHSTSQQDSDYGVSKCGNTTLSLTYDAYSQYVFEVASPSR